MSGVKLPAVIEKAASVLTPLTKSLGIPREVLAKDDMRIEE